MPSRLVALALCKLDRGGADHAVAVGNRDLGRMTGLAERSVQLALVELESAGLVYRIVRGDGAALATLEWVGYRDPWADRPEAHPPRAVALLWKLPPVAAGSREPSRPIAADRKGGRP